MRYGHFDDEHKEYVIERPDLPTSWTNYLGVGRNSDGALCIRGRCSQNDAATVYLAKAELIKPVNVIMLSERPAKFMQSIVMMIERGIEIAHCRRSHHEKD